MGPNGDCAESELGPRLNLKGKEARDMTRNLKALGLALIAAFAMSAVAASAASAVNHHFTGTSGEALTTESIGEQVFESTTGEEKGYKCKKVVTEKGTVPAGTVTSVPTTPKYEECSTFGPPGVANVKQEGCEFVFTGNTTTGNPTGGEHANVDIVCPAGKSIIIQATGLKLNCSTVYPQEIKHAVRYENETTAGNGKTHVRIKATAHGILSKTIGVCAEAPETHTNGSYTGEVTVSAPSGISVSNAP